MAVRSAISVGFPGANYVVELGQRESALPGEYIVEGGHAIVTVVTGQIDNLTLSATAAVTDVAAASPTIGNLTLAAVGNIAVTATLHKTIDPIAAVATAMPFVQAQVNNFSAGGTSTTISLTGTTAGNALILLGIIGSPGTISASDGTNTWSAVTLGGSDGTEQSLYADAFNIAGGDVTVTLDFQFNVAPTLFLVEVTGISSIDEVQFGTTATDTAWNLASVTTGHANDLIIAVAGNQRTNATFTNGSGSIPANGQANGGGACAAIEYQVVGAPGTYTPTITVSTSLAGSNCVIALTPTAATGKVIVSAAVGATIDPITAVATGLVISTGGDVVWPLWWEEYKARFEAERKAPREGDGVAFIPGPYAAGRAEHVVPRGGVALVAAAFGFGVGDHGVLSNAIGAVPRPGGSARGAVGAQGLFAAGSIAPRASAAASTIVLGAGHAVLRLIEVAARGRHWRGAIGRAVVPQLFAAGRGGAVGQAAGAAGVILTIAASGRGAFGYAARAAATLSLQAAAEIAIGHRATAAAALLAIRAEGRVVIGHRPAAATAAAAVPQLRAEGQVAIARRAIAATAAAAVPQLRAEGRVAIGHPATVAVAAAAVPLLRAEGRVAIGHPATVAAAAAASPQLWAEGRVAIGHHATALAIVPILAASGIAKIGATGGGRAALALLSRGCIAAGAAGKAHSVLVLPTAAADAEHDPDDEEALTLALLAA